MQQGSLQEQKERKRERFRLAVYSVFGGTTLLMIFFLIQGCKKETPPDTNNITTLTEETNNLPTNAVPDSNGAPGLTQMSGTNGLAVSNVPLSQLPIQQPIPQPQPQQPESVPGAAKEYVIGKGDSFYSISKKLGVKMSDIKAANPTVNPNKLKVGQKISVPDASGTGNTGASVVSTETTSQVYTVKSGDSLMKIAKKHGTTAKAIRSLNGLSNDTIKVGQKLKIAAKAPAPEPMPTVAPTSAMPAQPMPIMPANVPSTAPAGTTGR